MNIYNALLPTLISIVVLGYILYLQYKLYKKTKNDNKKRTLQ